MSPSRSYDALDEKVGKLLLALHKSHPNLGHNGLIHALKDESFEVDPQVLEQFMDENNIEGEHGGISRIPSEGYASSHSFIQRQWTST